MIFFFLKAVKCWCSVTKLAPLSTFFKDRLICIFNFIWWKFQENSISATQLDLNEFSRDFHLKQFDASRSSGGPARRAGISVASLSAGSASVCQRAKRVNPLKILHIVPTWFRKRNVDKSPRWDLCLKWRQHSISLVSSRISSSPTGGTWPPHLHTKWLPVKMLKL